MQLLLSVLVPVYNEATTVEAILRRVAQLPVPKEVIVVDDGSTDGTWERVQRVEGLQAFRHEKNRGKGAALKTALARATGDVVIIQDADLEYFPEDIPKLYARYCKGDVDAVYGSRILGRNSYSSVFFYLGGRLVSTAARLLFGTSLTDVPTGYKMIRTQLLRDLNIRSEGFDYCAEVTARILRRGGRVVELPIRYQPRSFAQGKKITARDGITAIMVLIKERLKPNA